ncbi:hypothetical protein LZ31DRAFT_345483 [Colletotrichum somersetense]|nr:hypothetical protein LZ31DRAFT_345483 [Colletotrichum somersetense]
MDLSEEEGTLRLRLALSSPPLAGFFFLFFLSFLFPSFSSPPLSRRAGPVAFVTRPREPVHGAPTAAECRRRGSVDLRPPVRHPRRAWPRRRTRSLADSHRPRDSGLCHSGVTDDQKR